MVLGLLVPAQGNLRHGQAIQVLRPQNGLLTLGEGAESGGNSLLPPTVLAP